MEFETHTLPHLMGRFPGISITDPYVIDSCHISLLDLPKLLHEKGFLENRLGKCAAYLQVLRKKQSRNERLLNDNPSPPRKKRKKLQQSNYELSAEIRNRERDESVLLNSLQTCKANIYIAGALAYTPTNMRSPVTNCASSPTQYSYTESEPTELSWNGWADEINTPFQTPSQVTILMGDLAPDAYLDNAKDFVAVIKNINRPLPLSRITEDAIMFLPVPPNTAHSQFSHSVLDPDAVVFESDPTHISNKGDIFSAQPDKLSISPSSAARRSSDAGLLAVMQRDLTSECEERFNVPRQITEWSRTGLPMRRRRSNSV
ncbi:hypothetical protein P153DRAFT_367048 [Dothidotthia symphoricarpi CBS 119687]|uniref:Uncharacterized protein n=1 Tax=Dothidotthia symphoricarpi CBS 119687 TaxID=1392245 RepID=A0A6A6AD29_9PLEO|nr:uncharacterized protein P153DRAFT_367048 [Dothidotthia symphoricarpi CBS 119687]KAF2129680.1 hypothetical protein P153DRAFT_367048 [Dothidotthia symphoricarpi CBS 119687]